MDLTDPKIQKAIEDAEAGAQAFALKQVLRVLNGERVPRFGGLHPANEIFKDVRARIEQLLSR